MDTTNRTTSTEQPPNHHAAHPGFSGIGGLVAALSFAVGREADADLAIRLAAVGSDDVVVDIGCGPGTAVRRAAAQGASSVVGVDPAPVMLRVARLLTRTSGRTGSHVRYLEGAAEALPLPDACATVVWSLATVHHWHDLDAGLAEVQRVLRAPARFVVLERRIEPGASGHASHGWTEDQADLFAKQCRAAGFSAEIGRHQAGHKAVLMVVARAA
jgi:ubiquinone/menaquinone biosynthesis C-methylase UbiE